MGTYVMLVVVFAWWAFFLYITFNDIGVEKKKFLQMKSNNGKLDPFLFSGEKARKEFLEYLEKHPETKKDDYVKLVLENMS